MSDRLNRLTVIASIAIVIAMAAFFWYLDRASFSLHPHTIDSRESLYNSIFILEHDGVRAMTFGHNRQLFTETEYDTRDELVLPSTYSRYMTAALAYAERTDKFLELGFGGGRVTRYLHLTIPDMDIVSVELDPVVRELALQYFGVREEINYRVEIADARRYLMGHESARWPVISVDAYRGPGVPFHLLTREFYELVKARLAPGGAMALNIAPSTMMFDAAIATVASVFDNLDLYDADGNMVAIAYDGPRRSVESLVAAGQRLDTQYGFRYPLASMVPDAVPVSSPPARAPLTDDFAPVDILRAIERHNLDILSFAEGEGGQP